jgi:hypothetical protein
MIRQQIERGKEIYFPLFSRLLSRKLCFLLIFLSEKVMRQAAVSMPS